MNNFGEEGRGEGRRGGESNRNWHSAHETGNPSFGHSSKSFFSD